MFAYLQCILNVFSHSNAFLKDEEDVLSCDVLMKRNVTPRVITALLLRCIKIQGFLLLFKDKLKWTNIPIQVLQMNPS